MKIEELASGREIEALIEPVTDADFKIIKKNRQFRYFNWSKYKGKEVYKIRAAENEEILGLMSIVDHTDPSLNAIEIELLEVRNDQIGENKELDRIAGCLIAFACRESFKRGHSGYLFLTPKTKLIPHYQEMYGLEYIPPIGFRLEGFMTADSELSRELINKYLS